MRRLSLCLAAFVRISGSQRRHPFNITLREGTDFTPVTSLGPHGLRSDVTGPTWASCLTFAASYAKGKAQKGATAARKAEPEVEFDVGKIERVMAQALQHFKAELANIRSGRANPGLLEPILVESNNERTQLRNFGTVTQRNPHLLVVNVFDEKDMDAVVKAVRLSPLQLQARVEGKEVHVPVPKPSVEVLQRMAKLVHQEAESAKASVRNGRHQGLDLIKRSMKDLPDERFRLEAVVQKLCDQYVADIEKTKQLKDKDLKDNH